MSPRIAQAVFQVPNADGRLPVLLDPRTDSVPIGPQGVQLLADADDIRLRQEAVPDLRGLQQAASDAGYPFWVVSGLQPPNAGSVAKVLPTAFVAPCAMDIPPRPTVTATASTPPSPAPTPDASAPDASAPDAPAPTVTPTSAPVAIAPQAWLGTVVRVSDDADHSQTADDDTANTTMQWLRANAWQYGFVPAIPETDAGAAIGREPWSLRWVGRPMAAQLEPLIDSSEYGPAARRVLEQAEDELASQAQVQAGAVVGDVTAAVSGGRRSQP